MNAKSSAPSRRKASSCDKIQISMERFDYLSKINSEHFELLCKHKEDQEMIMKLLKENNQYLEDLIFFKEMFHAQLSNILQ